MISLHEDNRVMTVDHHFVSCSSRSPSLTLVDERSCSYKPLGKSRSRPLVTTRGLLLFTLSPLRPSLRPRLQLAAPIQKHASEYPRSVHLVFEW